MRMTGVIVAAATCYATLRYNVFKGVAWEEWPVYVVNKVFALSALILLVRCVVQQRRRGTVDASLLTVAGGLMLTHVALSLAILDPAYYSKYFTGNKLTCQAGWSMLIGVVAALGIIVYSRACANRRAPSWIWMIAVLAFLSGIHAALLGYRGWFTPEAWPGYMVPITLISFAVGAIGIVVAAWPASKKR